MIILIISLLMSQASASDDWLCKDASSIRRGDSIYACGIAKGNLEDDAKQAAFSDAKKEFENICSISDDCKGHKVSVEAKRTECEDIPQMEDAFMPGQNYYRFKCYRLVVFTMEK
jgi:hypothetical protein